MDMSQYRDLFLSESRRHLDEINRYIVLFENNGDPTIVHDVFRHFHSLKGMAATMRFDRIASLAHKLEDLLANVRDGLVSPTQNLIDILLEGTDLLDSLVRLTTNGGDDTRFPDIDVLINRIIAFSTSNQASSEETVRAAGNASVSPPQPQFRHSDTFSTVQVKTSILDRMVNITGELITTHHRLVDRLKALGSGSREPLIQLESQLRELRDTVFQARMLPFSLVTERFPRLIRDLSRTQGKEISLRILGGDIELDRGILEKISEPLTHLVRNAVDHGIEPPQTRVSEGKDPCGRVTLSLTRNRDYVDISVSDDGQGMDPPQLITKALDRGQITHEQATKLSRRETLLLTCCPGFSTAEAVTAISGRGVGMDAVMSAVRSLGGNLSIESTLGSGSCFNLRLPLTVSIIQAMLIECGALLISFPVNAIDRALELTPGDIKFRDGKRYCAINGEILPLISLHQILGQPLPPCNAYHIPVIICTINGATTGLVVDQIIGQREIFIKPLGKPFSNLKHAMGGTILGDGRIIFLMDISALTPLLEK